MGSPAAVSPLCTASPSTGVSLSSGAFAGYLLTAAGTVTHPPSQEVSRQAELKDLRALKTMIPVAPRRRVRTKTRQAGQWMACSQALGIWAPVCQGPLRTVRNTQAQNPLTRVKGGSRLFTKQLSPAVGRVAPAGTLTCLIPLW